MLEIAIADAQVGQKLAQAVSDSSGKRLVEPGVEISETLLRVLQRRGVTSVFIQEASEDADDPLNDPVVKAQLDEMKERLVIGFQHHVENPTMAVLYATSHEYLTKRVLAENGK